MTSNEAELHQLEEAWADALADWAVPERYLAQVSTSPFELSPSSFRPDTARLRTPTLSWLAEELARLPEGERTLLDVGSGAGGTSLMLWPTAELITAVDQSEQMLAAVRDNAAELGIPLAALKTVNSRWPSLDLQSASVVVCANVLYNVPAPVAFLRALIDSASHAVVVEVTERHPHFGVNPLWLRFHGYRRPTQPSAEAVGAMLRLLGYEPQVARWERRAADPDDPEEVGRLARRACIPEERWEEVGAYLRAEPLQPTGVMAFRVQLS